jgi:hypothetical protein
VPTSSFLSPKEKTLEKKWGGVPCRLPTNFFLCDMPSECVLVSEMCPTSYADRHRHRHRQTQHRHTDTATATATATDTQTVPVKYRGGSADRGQPQVLLLHAAAPVCMCVCVCVRERERERAMSTCRGFLISSGSLPSTVLRQM